MAYKSNVKIKHFDDKKSIRLRNDDTHATVFEFRFHLHMVNGELFVSVCPVSFLSTKWPVEQQSLEKKSFGKVNLAEGTMSTCGNKTLHSKWEGLWERNIPLKYICTIVPSGHLFGKLVLLNWNSGITRNDPVLKALANALITFKLQALFHFSEWQSLFLFLSWGLNLSELFCIISISTKGFADFYFMPIPVSTDHGKR